MNLTRVLECHDAANRGGIHRLDWAVDKVTETLRLIRGRLRELIGPDVSYLAQRLGAYVKTFITQVIAHPPNNKIELKRKKNKKKARLSLKLL